MTETVDPRIELFEENESITHELKLSIKFVEFLKEYRNLLIKFSANCICNHNKPLINSFKTFETHFEVISDEFNDFVVNSISDSNVNQIDVINKIHEELDQLINNSSLQLLASSDSNEPTLNSISVPIRPIITIDLENDNTEEVIPISAPIRSNEMLWSSQSPNGPNFQSLSTQVMPSFQQPMILLLPFPQPIPVPNQPTLEVTPLQSDTPVPLCPSNQNIETRKPRPIQIDEKTALRILNREMSAPQRTKMEQMVIFQSKELTPSLLSHLSDKRKISLLKEGKIKSFPLNDWNKVTGQKGGVDTILYKCTECVYESKNRSTAIIHVMKHKPKKISAPEVGPTFTPNPNQSTTEVPVISIRVESPPITDSVHWTAISSNQYNPNQIDENTGQTSLYQRLSSMSKGGRNKAERLMVSRAKEFTPSLVSHLSDNRNLRLLKEGKISSFTLKKQPKVTVYQDQRQGVDTILYKCTECGFEKKEKYLVLQHMYYNKHNMSEPNKMCDTRNVRLLREGKIKSFTSSKNDKITVYQGQIEGVDTILYKCTECGFENKLKYVVLQHLSQPHNRYSVPKIKQLVESGECELTVHSDDPNCSVINRKFINQENGTTQLTGVGFKCNYENCSFICIYMQSMGEHLYVHQNGKTFKCQTCHSMFGSRRLLVHHHNRMHTTSNDPLLECHIDGCDYRTFVKNSLEEHNLWHQTESLNESNDCLSTESEVCPDSEAKKLNCDYPNCGKPCDDKPSLYKHMERHKKERLKCDECGRLCPNSGSLKIHKNKHKNETLYECPHCPYKTPKKYCFSMHAIKHKTDRPFKCDSCELSFKSRNSLFLHKKTHSDVRPYPCDWPGCDMAFKMKTTQQNHLRTHKIDNIRYGCDYCDITYKYKGDLNRHIKRDHLIDE